MRLHFSPNLLPLTLRFAFSMETVHSQNTIERGSLSQVMSSFTLMLTTLQCAELAPAPAPAPNSEVTEPATTSTADEEPEPEGEIDIQVRSFSCLFTP